MRLVLDWRYPFGRPLRRAAIESEVLSKRLALPIFASDALSSIAYATEEILKVLALAGVAYFGESMWIAAVIVAMLAVLLTSYRQVIFAYPNGGGAYVVARDNLGETPAQIAGVSLLVDYILTVSVSLASGVANFSSGLHQFIPLIPNFNTPTRVLVSLAVLALMWYVNKRGLRESGRAFSIPTYFFLFSMFFMLAVGFGRAFMGGLPVVQNVDNVVSSGQALTLLLILRAFASGSTAVTGIEAISNGVTAFEEPKARNATATQAILGVLLAAMFLGITRLALLTHTQASMSETVISQLGRTVFGPHSPFYVAVVFGTAAVLLMAANTSFNGFPRLAALQAADGFLPRWMLDRDNRLVFGVGISVLSLAAAVLLIVFEADVTHLIPLYAIGVFLSFTLCQTGMVVRWLRTSRLRPGERIPRYSPEGVLLTVLAHDRRWQLKLAVNAFGAVMTAAVTVVFAFAKFTEGAWIVVLLIPALLTVLFRIHRHYRQVTTRMAVPEDLDLDAYLRTPENSLHLLVIGSFHRQTLPALRHFCQLTNRTGRRIALHVGANDEDVAALRREWQDHRLREDFGLPLKILPSEYGAGDIIGQIVGYVRGALAVDPELRVNLVIADWAANRSWWGWLFTPALHHLTGARLRLAFNSEDRVTVTNYRYVMDDVPPRRSSAAFAQDD